MDIQLANQIIQLDRRVSVLETLEIPGNFTPSGILFANASGLIAQDSLFVWDSTNDRLGIGTNTPSAFTHIQAAGGSKTFLYIEDTGANTDTLFKITASGVGSGSTLITAADQSNNVRFSVRGDGLSTFRYYDGNTNNAPSIITLGHRTTGTAAASFGNQIDITADSSTTQDRNQFSLITSWVTATDASRTSRIRLFAYDTASRECFRMEANGTGALISFFGGAAAGRQNITGVRTGTLAQLQGVVANMLTALQNYNLWVDSTT